MYRNSFNVNLIKIKFHTLFEISLKISFFQNWSLKILSSEFRLWKSQIIGLKYKWLDSLKENYILKVTFIFSFCTKVKKKIKFMELCIRIISSFLWASHQFIKKYFFDYFNFMSWKLFSKLLLLIQIKKKIVTFFVWLTL